MGDRRHITKGHHAESGILRKAKPQHTAEAHLDDLLVFGYACKIFRDNDRASEIDHGKHLIPWMNDHSLKIDRYDVRATLSDIRPYEPPPGGFSDRMASLTPAEQRAEQLCEEERYLSLYNNDVEEEMYKDEELKRLHKQRSSTYGQVAFDYDAKPTQSTTETKSTNQEHTVEEEPDTPYQSNPRFYVPPDIELPDSMKLHAVIEKTAKFIAAQGPQMEILIKAKQSNNQQFEFLNIDNRLNRYYKHLLNAVKHGFYPADEPEVEPPTQEVSTPAVEEQPAIVVPQIRYKPSADCSYTQLISKIKGVPIPVANGAVNALLVPSEVKFPADTNFQHIMEYRNKMLMNVEVHAKNQANSSNSAKPPTVSAAETFVGRKPAAPLLATPISGRVAPPKVNVVRPPVVPATAEVKKISTGLMLAQCYNSETDDDEDEDVDAHPIPKVDPPKEAPVVYDFPVPEPELRNIIDKTAAYVLKNGKEFEEILRTKNDERFAFLKYTDQHYRYYVHKVTGAICSAPLPAKPIEEAVEKTNGVSNKTPKESAPSDVPSKVITSVSFSIKPKDDVALKPAVLREASSDEENVSSLPKSPVKTALPNVVIKPMNAALLPTPSLPILNTTPSTVPVPSLPSDGFSSINAPDSRPPSPLLQANSIPVEAADSTICDAIFDEKPTPTNGQTEAIKEAKRAEERVRDRLAQVARDKLGQVNKDKQLQLERRKKAMAFLNQIKPTDKEEKVQISTISTEPEALEAVPIPEGSPNPKTPETVSKDSPDGVESVELDKESPIKFIDTHREGSVISVHSADSSPARPVLVVENGGIVSDDDSDQELVVGEKRRKRSRKHSRSLSKSSSSKRHKSKKSKKHRHHAKKSKSSSRRSRSVSRRSRSVSHRSRSPIRSRSHSIEEESSSSRRRRRRSRSRSTKRSRPVEAYHQKTSSRKHRHRDRDYD